jgi:hypothetical protein
MPYLIYYMKLRLRYYAVLAGILLICVAVHSQTVNPWVRYSGFEGPGSGKHIVFISGDEEYRSEEALPMLAQILAKRYGFTCTVLFATHPETGEIDPLYLSNINGLASLEKADLMVMFTRFRELPDSQMQYIDAYIGAGKPVIGLRTATHAFQYKKNKNSLYAKYDVRSRVPGWEDGFGRKILGETWISHHGEHMEEGTRGLINGIELNKKNPLLNGVSDIWTPTDVYTVRNLGNADILVYGQSTSGMTAAAPVNLRKAIMPVAWTRTYTGDHGETGRVFSTTMGSSVDLLNEDFRRLMINACFWASGLENRIPEKADVGFVSEYKPVMFGYGLFKKKMVPADFALKK